MSKSLEGPPCHRMKFTFLNLVFSAFHALDFASVSSSTSLLPTLSPLNLSWTLILSPCCGPTLTFFPLSIWPISFLSLDSDFSPPPPCPYFSLSITYASAIACSKLCCLLSLYKMSSLRLQGAVFHLSMLRPISLLIQSRNSINVSNELIKVTQRNIYLMEEFNIIAREYIFH